MSAENRSAPGALPEEFKPPSNSITDQSKAEVLLWLLLPVFGMRFAVTFHLTCVHIILSSVRVAEWQPFVK